MAADQEDPGRPTSFRRSSGSARGEARRAELLTRVTDDLAVNGLVDFSLRRAARVADTTHKVLLYHFASADDLLAQALLQLRARRVDNVMDAVAPARAKGRLADRIRSIWPILEADTSGLRVIDQAIGLAMYDPDRYAHLARGAVEQYQPALLSILPDDWAEERRREVGDLLLAVFRGFLMDWRTTGDSARIRSAVEALARALDREDAAPR